MSNVPPVPQASSAPAATKPTDPKEGRYKAKAVTPDATSASPGSPHEFGKSKHGTPELLVHLFLPDLNRTYVSPLYFSTDAAPYSEERLRALGCVDIVTLAGIDTNEVDVELKYELFEGSWRTRVQILSGGGGVFHTSNPVGGKEFGAIIQATLGRPINLSGAAGAANGGGGGAPPKAPF
jgi:hypothetical protein